MDADSSTLIWMQIGNPAIPSNDQTLGIIFNLMILILLILFNAAYAATEMAVITMNDNKIRKMAEEGDKNAKKIAKLLEKPTHFLSTIQVGITFGGFFASAFAADKFAAPLTLAIDPMTRLPWLGAVSVIFITIVLSFLSLVFGELVPKRIAMRSPYTVIKYTLGLLTFTGAILKPFVYFLTVITNLTLRIIGINPEEHERTVTEEEIRMMVDVGRETGTIHANEKEMIENIFEFNDTQVSEIMTHRTNIVSLEVKADFQEVLGVAVNEKFTRIPVYKDSIDNIIGILHIKDLLALAIVGLEHPFSLEKMIREPFIVPETKTIDETFHEMQKAHEQIAVVIDEYGGTAGIITMEDLLEEIVGNMQDEYDEEDEEIVRQDANTLIVDGMTGLDEISDELNIKFSDDRDYDTIAGLVIDLLGRIPDEEENPEVAYLFVTFTVLEMEEKRISKIKISINPSAIEKYSSEFTGEKTDSQQNQPNSNNSQNKSKQANTLNQNNPSIQTNGSKYINGSK